MRGFQLILNRGEKVMKNTVHDKSRRSWECWRNLEAGEDPPCEVVRKTSQESEDQVVVARVLKL